MGGGGSNMSLMFYAPSGCLRNPCGTAHHLPELGS